MFRIFITVSSFNRRISEWIKMQYPNDRGEDLFINISWQNLHNNLQESMGYNLILPPYPYSIFKLRTIKKFIYEWIENNNLNFLIGNCEILTPNDTGPEFQILISALKPLSVSLYEDGLGNYLKRAYGHSLLRQIVRFLFHSKIIGKEYFNIKGIGKSRVDFYYGISKEIFPFLKEEEKKKLRIVEPKWRNNLIDTEKLFTKCDEKIIFVLISDPSVEEGIIKWSHYKIYLERLHQWLLDNGINTIYVKFHPRESKEKSKKVVEILSKDQIEVIEIQPHGYSIEEILLSLENKKKIKVIGLVSSVLFYIKLFSKDIEVLSSVNMLPRIPRSFVKYIELLEKVGVKKI